MFEFVKRIWRPNRNNMRSVNTPAFTYAQDIGTEVLDISRYLSGVQQTAPEYADFSGIGLFTYLPRRYETLHQTDLGNLRSYTAREILDILIDIEPDISFAVWDLLRIADTKEHYKALDLNRLEDSKGQEILDEIVNRFNSPKITDGYIQNNCLPKIKNQLHLMAFVRGAVAVEVVPTEDLNDILKIVVVDPASIVFSSEGNRIIPWQYQPKGDRSVGVWQGNYKKLDYANFIYEEVDALVNDPYGRAPLLSAIQTIFFKIQVLADLKAVVHNQGYPRIDVSVMEEILIKNAPPAVRNDPVKLRKFVDEQMGKILLQFSALKPDSSLIHFDSVKVTSVGGNQGPLIDVQKLMNVIDSQIVAGTKTLSVMLGRHFGKTETYANLEIKIYTRGIESIQKVAERTLERALQLALWLKGHQGYVDVSFDPVEWRSDNELEQFRQLKIKNVLTLVDRGYLSDEEASIQLTGHKPNGTPKQEATSTPAKGEADNGQANAGGA